MRRKALPYCVGRCWIQLLCCPSQLIFIAYPYCTLIAYLYWIEGRCRPVIQISLAYLCWIEGPCRPVIQIFIALSLHIWGEEGWLDKPLRSNPYSQTVQDILIAYLHCLSYLHIFITYLCCISLLHIFIAYLYYTFVLHILVAYLYCIFIEYLYCLSLLHICIAYLCCISVLHICIT